MWEGGQESHHFAAGQDVALQAGRHVAREGGSTGGRRPHLQRADLTPTFRPTSCHCKQVSQAGREVETARAEVAAIKHQQEAERARVKKAVTEMKRKIDA